MSSSGETRSRVGLLAARLGRSIRGLFPRPDSSELPRPFAGGPESFLRDVKASTPAPRVANGPGAPSTQAVRLLPGQRFGSFEILEELGSGGMANVPGTFISSFVLQLIAASMIAALLGPNSTGGEGLQLGTLIAVSFVFTAMGMTNLFEHRPLYLIAINSCYHVVSFGLMGFIIGTWG